MQRLLAHRDARLFLAGQSLSLLGDTALWLALGLWAKDLTGSSSAAGLVILCIVAPGLASPLAGLLVDRVRRRSLLLAVNPLTALAVLPLLAVDGPADVWIIYAVALAYGASYTVLAAGQSALLTTLLEPDLLAPANAALQTVREALRLIAPLAGAGLYTLAGGAAVALLDAATFLAATVALLALKLREPRPERHHEPRAVLAGARHINASLPLRQMVGGCALCMLVIGFSETLIFELPHALGKPDSFVGVLMAVQGIGAIAGALTATRVLHRHGELGAAGFGMTIFALGALLMADSALGIVLAGKALFGLGLPWIVVALLTLLQRNTPSHLQGRAFAATELALTVPQTLSIALGAALVALVDYRLVLLVQAFTVGSAGIWLLLTMHGPWRPSIRISTTSWSRPTGSRERTRVATCHPLAPEMGDHLIVMHSAVRALPGYNRHDAPAIIMDGPSTARETEQGRVVTAQIARPHGTLNEALYAGISSLSAAHIPKAIRRQAREAVEDYFYNRLDLAPELALNLHAPLPPSLEPLPEGMYRALEDLVELVVDGEYEDLRQLSGETLEVEDLRRRVEDDCPEALVLPPRAHYGVEAIARSDEPGDQGWGFFLDLWSEQGPAQLHLEGELDKSGERYVVTLTDVLP